MFKSYVNKQSQPIVAMSIRGNEIPMELAIQDEEEYRRMREFNKDKTIWDFTVYLYYRNEDGTLDGFEHQVLGNAVVFKDDVIDIGNSYKYMRIRHKYWDNVLDGLEIQYVNDLKKKTEYTLYQFDRRLRLPRIKEALSGFLTDFEAPATAANEPMEPMEPIPNNVAFLMDSFFESLAEMDKDAVAYSLLKDKVDGSVHTGLIEFFPRTNPNIPGAAYNMAVKKFNEPPTRYVRGNVMGHLSNKSLVIPEERARTMWLHGPQNKRSRSRKTRRRQQRRRSTRRRR
jgi:hypothetical protein